ncbi:class A beta-lactamase [Terricaulis silvestris]|uniref:beta-lactamase n=1 Tax=Terricaulis silvestris TaxID=2686094 RepID=A0A6I6MQ28_9CAUL|nr:class A beta-lactamase [Terricaulis silvestris]QGZ93253.1 Beta-lactamase AST-1 precursor [Terricaulis silvestris]
MQRSVELTRRATLVGGAALAACAPMAPADPRESYVPPPDDQRFAAIEARIGGRVGVAAWNTGTDAWLGHRRNEAFAMCSTFKWALTAAVLHTAQRAGGPQLNEIVCYNQSDMLSHAPVTSQHLERGWMTVEELCAAAVITSDNPAANLLLELQFGPEGFTRFLRANGDGVTRLDRTELALNENLPGDPRDTTTPDAMARTLKRFLLEDGVLNAASREKLTGWMETSTTGLSRLRAGLPAGWRVGDKTGTSTAEHNATNDVAIAWPPGRAPIIITSYLSESMVELDARNAAHAEIARIIAGEWA